MTRIEELERELAIWKWVAGSRTRNGRQRYKLALSLISPDEPVTERILSARLKAKRTAEQAKRTAKRLSDNERWEAFKAETRAFRERINNFEWARKPITLADKLRRMTVENGCTPAEAEIAKRKLADLRGRAS